MRPKFQPWTCVYVSCRISTAEPCQSVRSATHRHVCHHVHTICCCYISLYDQKYPQELLDNMMLSTSAARMGCVRTTLREIGKRKLHSTARSVRGRKFLITQYIRVPLASELSRWKSTMATYSDSEDESELLRPLGHAEVSKARSVSS